MIQNIHTRFQIAESKGQIPAGTALGFTTATALLAGTAAFHEAYFGSKAWNEARASHRAATRESDRVAGTVMEAALSAATSRSVARALSEAHTTSDFPLLLANIRDRVIRQEYNPVESDLAGESFVQRRTATNFKMLQGVRNSSLSEIPVRPEGTDVELTTLVQTEDGYRVANYERGIEYTWELFLNDELSVFTNALAALGRAARRTRALGLFRAIKDAKASVALGGVGGPNVARVVALVNRLADYTITVEGKTHPAPIELTDIFAPLSWKTMLQPTLTSPTITSASGEPEGNPAFGQATPHYEKIMGEVFGKDWIGLDASVPSIELAVLTGFEAGPKTYTQMCDVKEISDEGSFKNHTYAVKVGDAFGWKVIEPHLIEIVKGA